MRQHVIRGSSLLLWALVACHQSTTTPPSMPPPPPEVDVPITVATAADKTLRFSVPITVGSSQINVELDTGSSGLRIFQNAIPASAYTMPSQMILTSQQFHSGLIVSGFVATAPVTIGSLTTKSPVPIQIITQEFCATGVTDCPHTGSFSGFGGVLGVGMRTKATLVPSGVTQDFTVGNPIAQIDGHPAFAVSVPAFGMLPATGTLRLFPSAMAQFSTIQLRSAQNTVALPDGTPAWDDTGFTTCVTNTTSTAAPYCAATLLDTGNPSLQIELPDHSDTAEFPYGSRVQVQVEPSLGQYAFTVGSTPADGLDHVVVGSSNNNNYLIDLGTGVFFRNDVLFDQAHGLIGMAPKMNAACKASTDCAAGLSCVQGNCVGGLGAACRRSTDCTAGPSPACPAVTGLAQSYCTSGCASDSDCGEGAKCIAGSLQTDGGTASSCVRTCTNSKSSCPSSTACIPNAYNSGVAACEPWCLSDADCATGRCDVSRGTCVGGDIGDSCQRNADCFEGTSPMCRVGTGLSRGSCTSTCSTTYDCNATSNCVASSFRLPDGGSLSSCIPVCQSDSDCSPGSICTPNAFGSHASGCVPGCLTNDDCANGLACAHNRCLGGVGAACEHDSECAGSCRIEPGLNRGYCTSVCDAGTDCPGNSLCVPNSLDGGDAGMLSSCVRNCQTAACPISTVCSSNAFGDGVSACVPGCQTDRDCSGAFTCDTTSSECVAPGKDAGPEDAGTVVDAGTADAGATDAGM